MKPINIKKLYNQTKASAKTRGIYFNLSLTFLNNMSFPITCPYLNIPLNYETFNEYSPSVDRIDNSLGYIDRNIEIISIKANTMKNSATKEELINFANRILLEMT